MPHDSNSNAPSSGKTSGSAPTTPLSESAYLTKQASDARAAISRTVDDLKHELLHSVDPAAWMKAHPWATLAGAALAGFVASAATIPSKEQAALKRLAEIEKALMPKYRDPIAEANGDGSDMRKPPRSAGSSFLAGLAGQVLHAIQPVLMSAVTAGVTAKAVDEDQPTGGQNPAEAAAAPGQAPPVEKQSAGSDPSI